jgi:high-affinity iron transporter
MSKIIIILFRESIEIALLLGTVFAATKNIPNSWKHIVTGILIGLLGSSILAFFTSNISNAFDGFGQEIFNITVLSVSIAMIGWTVVWMKGRAKHLKRDLSEISDLIVQGKVLALTLPLMIATFIFREGTEIVLFVYSILTVETLSLTQLIISIAAGTGTGLIIGVILYLGLTQYSGRRLFKVTSWLFILIAASLSTELANLFNSIGFFTPLSFIIWDSSWLIKDTSIIGHLFNTLIGYQAQPTLLQLLFYLMTIVSILLADKIYNGRVKTNLN